MTDETGFDGFDWMGAPMDGWVRRHIETTDRRDDDDDDASERDDDASDDADDEPRTPRGGDDDDDARGGDVRSAFAVHEGDALRRRGLGEGGRGGDGDERGHRAHRNGAKKTDERYVSHFMGGGRRQGRARSFPQDGRARARTTGRRVWVARVVCGSARTPPFLHPFARTRNV